MNNSGDGSDEREFLHKIATPIGTAVFLIDCLMDRYKSRPDNEKTNDEQQELEQIFQALEKVAKLLRDRRDVLVARGVPSARS